ncbi:MAG: rhodanese-like domain-containing protein [Pseudomonadota bacterium]
MSNEKLMDCVFSDIECPVCLSFLIDENAFGLIGLGSRITDEGYSEEDQKLLLTLANNLIVFLGNMRSFETIKNLNMDLEKRNIQLKKSIEELTASRRKIEVLERAKSHIRSAIRKEMERTRRVSGMDFILILGFALVLSLIFNYSNPSGVNLIPETWLREPTPVIDVQDAKVKYDTETALFLDARPADFFKQRSIQGAINLPLNLFDFVYMMKFTKVQLKREIIVFGRNISKLYDEEVAFRLASRGHTNVKILRGGLSAWQEKGYPLTP